MSFPPFSLCLPLPPLPPSWLVCLRWVCESFCLSDYNRIRRLICKGRGGTLWIFHKCEIHWRWPTLAAIKGQALDVLEHRKYKTLYRPWLSGARLRWILFMNVIMYLCCFLSPKYSYLLEFSPGGVWQHLHLKKKKKIHAPFLQIRLIIIAMKELTTRFINFTLKVLYSPVHL